MKSPLFVLSLILLLAACKPDSSSKSSTSSDTSAAAAQAVEYPQLPIETLRTLVAECDHIDFTMYRPQLSMSQDMPEVIKMTLGHISELPAVHNTANQPNGHVFYQAKGETLLDADLYILKDKSYLVFYKDGKPAFANAMTSDGVAFFDNIFSRMQQMAPQ